MKRLIITTALIGLPLLAACNPSASSQPTNIAPATAPTIAPATIRIEAKEFAYAPAKPTVKVGQTVEIVLKNTGVTVHDFTIAKINLKGKAIAHGAEHQMDHSQMGAVDPDALPVHVAAETGHEATVTFTPTEPGEYEFYCTVAGHKASGMVGKLIVVQPE